MAWSGVHSWTTGELVTASTMTTYINNNLLATAAAIVTTAGDITYASGANALSRLAIGSAGNPLYVASGVPAWNANITFTSAGGATFASSVTVGAASVTTPGKLSVQADSAIALALRSSVSTAYTYLSIGRNGHEGSLAVIASANQFLTGTAGGDTALVASGGGRNLWLGTDSAGFLALATNNTLAWKITSGGHWLAGTDNQFDIGASGATRPRTGYFATSVVLGSTGLDGVLDSATNANRFSIQGVQYITMTSSTWRPIVDATSASGVGFMDLGTSSFHWRDAYVWRAAFNGSLAETKRNDSVLDVAEALRVARATTYRRFQYVQMGEDDPGAEAWHIGYFADDVHHWLSHDNVHVNPQTTASVALAAVAGEADAREREIAALRAEIAQLRGRRN